MKGELKPTCVIHQVQVGGVQFTVNSEVVEPIFSFTKFSGWSVAEWVSPARHPGLEMRCVYFETRA